MPATQNQIDFIKDICEVIDIYCDEKHLNKLTVKEASDFIDEYLDDYNERKKEIKRG